MKWLSIELTDTILRTEVSDESVSARLSDLLDVKQVCHVQQVLHGLGNDLYPASVHKVYHLMGGVSVNGGNVSPDGGKVLMVVTFRFNLIKSLK